MRGAAEMDDEALMRLADVLLPGDRTFPTASATARSSVVAVGAGLSSVMSCPKSP